ncbi:hypothetical protein H0H87_010107, partial [Tephrocybe sp. NHM501043]
MAVKYTVCIVSRGIIPYGTGGLDGFDFCDVVHHINGPQVADVLKAGELVFRGRPGRELSKFMLFLNGPAHCVISRGVIEGQG